jgi:hypothetical protein
MAFSSSLESLVSSLALAGMSDVLTVTVDLISIWGRFYEFVSAVTCKTSKWPNVIDLNNEFSGFLQFDLKLPDDFWTTF